MKDRLKKYFLNPINHYLHDSRSIGITLLVCTALSLIMANSGELGIHYQAIWNDSFSGTQDHYFHFIR